MWYAANVLFKNQLEQPKKYSILQTLSRDASLFRVYCFSLIGYFVMPSVEWDVLTFYRAHRAVNGHLDYHLHCPKGVGIWSIFFWVCVCVSKKSGFRIFVLVIFVVFRFVWEFDIDFLWFAHIPMLLFFFFGECVSFCVLILQII